MELGSDYTVVRTQSGHDAQALFNLISDEAIETSIQTALKANIEDEPVLRVQQRRFHAYTSLPHVKSAAPDWVNLQSLRSELCRLNSQTFWVKAVASVDIFRDYKRPNIFGGPAAGTSRIASAIMSENTQFYGLALQYIGLSALLGQEFKSALSAGQIEANPVVGAGLELASQFDSIATSPAEFLLRYRSMFQTVEGQSRAMRILIATDAFTKIDRFQKEVLKCPAVIFTEKVFLFYLRHLESEYGRRLIEAITTPEVPSA